MIPMATTTITLLSPTAPAPDVDDWGGVPDTATGFHPVATGIRAHFSVPIGVSPGMATVTPAGSTSSVVLRLLADPCDLRPDMLVRDDTTGVTYSVSWMLERGLPIPYVTAGVTHSTSTA